MFFLRCQEIVKCFGPIPSPFGQPRLTLCGCSFSRKKKQKQNTKPQTPPCGLRGTPPRKKREEGVNIPTVPWLGVEAAVEPQIQK